MPEYTFRSGISATGPIPEKVVYVKPVEEMEIGPDMDADATDVAPRRKKKVMKDGDTG